MRENKLIKIIENIKESFAELSEAKDLEEFVQILHGLGYTGNAKDLELDLFDILQNLSDEELKMVSGGGHSIRTKFGAGILGGLTALNCVPSGIAANDGDIVRSLVRGSDLINNDEPDYEAIPKGFLLTEDEVDDIDSPAGAKQGESSSEISSDFVPYTENDSDNIQNDDTSEETSDDDNDESAGVESTADKKQPKISNPSAGEQTARASGGSHFPINLSDLASLLALMASFGGGAMSYRYVLRKTTTKSNQTEDNSQTENKYRAKNPPLQEAILQIKLIYANLEKMASKHNATISQLVRPLVDLYIAAALLDEAYICQEEDFDESAYMESSKKIYLKFIEILETNMKKYGLDQQIYEILKDPNYWKSAETDGALRLTFDSTIPVGNTQLPALSSNGQLLYPCSLDFYAPGAGHTLSSLRLPRLSATNMYWWVNLGSCCLPIEFANYLQFALNLLDSKLYMFRLAKNCK